jgi:thiamine pyrophosphate-dependent acetolactate synthase large subunit-like protein
MNDQLWLDAETEIKRYISAMPEECRRQIKKVAQKNFIDAYSEIRETKEKYDRENSPQQKHYLLRRYIYLYKTLAINVGLHMIGARNYLGFKSPDQDNNHQ